MVDNVQVDDPDEHEWVPAMAFLDQQGNRAEFSPRMRGTGQGLATGRAVPVVYLGTHPRTARVHMWRHMTGQLVFLSLGGAAFLGAGVLIALTS
ncbi:hypothetical protein [Streptomyces sp. NPDC001135]